MQEKILEAINLRKIFGKRTVVNSVSLNVKSGEIVGLLGTNGAGKTTTFYMMVGLIKACHGTIKLSGNDITSVPINKRALSGIGYLPQESSVFRDLSVKENILVVLENRRMSPKRKKNLLESLMHDFGLMHLEKIAGKSLSGGERRRVEIARTLALEPDFILLDEPFAGVDPLAVCDIQEIIKELKNKNIGVLITDHNVRETLEIVDRAYIMNSGEILTSGTTREILNSKQAKKFYLGENFKL